jgi:hypothetical protein
MTAWTAPPTVPDVRRAARARDGACAIGARTYVAAVIISAGMGAALGIALSIPMPPLVLLFAPDGAALGATIGAIVALPVVLFATAVARRWHFVWIALGMQIITLATVVSLTLGLTIVGILHARNNADAETARGIGMLVSAALSGFGVIGALILSLWYRKRWPS